MPPNPFGKLALQPLALQPASPSPAHPRASPGHRRQAGSARVAAVVLNYSQYALTRDCLSSLAEVEYPCLNVILVDNGSSDESGKRLRSEFPAVDTILLRQNRGVAGGRNCGARRALALEADYILFLDNDVLVSPDSVGKLVAVADAEPSLGAVAPAVYIHPARPRATDRTLFALGGVYYPWLAHSRLRGMGQAGATTATLWLDCDWLSGVASLNRNVLFEEVGFLDERFSPYGPEDLDWGIRVRRAGYRLGVVPQAQVWHRRQPGVRRNAAVVRHWARGRVLFLRKHLRRRDWPLAGGFFLVYLVGLRRILPFALQREWQAIGELLQGLKDGVRYPA